MPSVKQEIEGIVKVGNRDVLPGEAHFDGEFTAKRLHDMLDKSYSVLHIASHFVFKPGNLVECGDPNPPYTGVLKLQFSPDSIKIIDRENQTRRRQTKSELRLTGCLKSFGLPADTSIAHHHRCD